MPGFLGGPRFEPLINGQIASGALLYTYAAGTTTPLATYPTIADAVALTNPLPNPVVLDSDGGLTIVMLATGYKLLLKDSAGNTVDGYPVDNFFAIADVLGTNTQLYDTGGFVVVDGTGTTLTLGATDTTGVITSIGGSTVSTMSSTAVTQNFTTMALTGSTSVTITGATITASGTTVNLAGTTTTALGGASAAVNVTGTRVGLLSDQPITDSSDNEYIKFSKTASAVNEVTVTNAATGTAPKISATGGDTNIDLALLGKGTGGVLVRPTAVSAGSTLTLQTTDGSGAIAGSFALKSSATQSVNYVSTLPTNAPSTFAPLVFSPSNPGTCRWGTIISSGNASIVSQLDFTGLVATTPYSSFLLVVTSISVASTSDLLIRVSNDNGSSFLTTATYGSHRLKVTGTTVTGATSSTATSVTAAVGGLTGVAASGYVRFWQPSSALMGFAGAFSGVDGSATVTLTQFTGTSPTTTTVNAIRLLPSAGTISLSYILYGVS